MSPTLSPSPPPPPHHNEEEEVEVSDSESVASSVVPRRVKRSRLRDKYLFTDEQEVELAEFYKENNLFYNKKVRAYMDSEKKKRLLEEKAASMSPPCTGEHCFDPII